jgi:hypothetical protein
MDELEKPLEARAAAKHALIAATRRVGDALPSFSAWLLGGLGAAFTLVLANIETVTRFIEITHIRFGLIIFLISLAVAVLATYLGTIVKAALGAQEDGDLLARRVYATGKAFDAQTFFSEYERGLLPHIRWIAGFQMRKAKAGDVVASARMIAKLSQVQALLVVAQSLLALLAIGGLAVGLKMQ